MVDGTTALMLAKELGHDGIAKILQEWTRKAKAKAKAKTKAKAKAKAKVSQKRMKTKAKVKIAKTEALKKRPATKTRV